MIDSRVLFTVLVALVALQRVLEMRVSERHSRTILAAGGREHAPGHFAVMKAVHASWLVAMLAEVWWLDPPAPPALVAVALAGLASGQALRYAAMRTLGERWTVRIYTLPEAPPVTGGPFRYLRHPNYLGVVLEIAALPLVHGAWRTALTWTIANALLLRVRIRAEEAALAEDNGYAESFEGVPRFLPVGERERGGTGGG